jgi:ribonuclease BN (tRNA processing enzyme)
MANLELTVLGSGTCAPTLQRSTASYFLRMGDLNVLIDVGFGSIRRMMEAGIDYREIDVIFISHTHLDHVADFGPLMMALKYTPNFTRTKLLTIIGPNNSRNYFQKLAELLGSWIYENEDFKVNFIELTNESFSLENSKITALSMSHGKSANGYRIQFENKIIAYSGDTGECENIVKLSSHSDLSILECSFPDESPLDGHLTPTLAGQIAHKAQTKQLLLTHLYPQMEKIDVKGICAKHFSSKISVAQDLQKITV